MTKNRALVSGSGKKPYKQKGTGRPQVGSTRTPLWRHGGTVFGPQPRSYDYALPKKVERGALRAALTAQAAGRRGRSSSTSSRAAEIKTKPTAALLQAAGRDRRGRSSSTSSSTRSSARSARNIAGVTLVASGRLTARDVMNTTRIIATRAAVERLQEVLG